MPEATIFISYRREDSAGYTRLVCERLNTRFPGRVFMDVSGIEAGDDFVEAIRRAIGSSKVVIVLIGKQWISCTGADGRRRLDDPHDFVRLEIMASFEHNVRVIPVLSPGVPMPSEDQLPEVLAALSRRQAIQLTEQGFDDDVARLLRVLEQELGPSAESAVRLHAMNSNSGWSVYLELADRHAKEIYYRFDDDADFRCTGFSHSQIDSITGSPAPNCNINLPFWQGTHMIHVKYVDSRGSECGPYSLPFDTTQQTANATRDILDSIPNWIAFREYPEGTMLVYFSTLLS